MKRFAFILASLVCGCITSKPGGPVGYFGPTQSLREVVSAINANNAHLATLWSRGDFEATVVDQGKSHFVNGEAFMLYRRPGDFLMVGKKDLAGQVFQVGCNAQQYWMIVRGDTDTMWWGATAQAGEVDPKVMPIQPMLLLEVLGIGEIDTDLTREPCPVMRFNNDADAYMLVWNMRAPDRWLAQKEVWYDRQTMLPKLVLLFDANGRVVLRAYLSGHKAVEAAGATAGQPPRVATIYQLYFPDNGTRMTIELKDVASRKAEAPSDASFKFPGEKAGVSRVVHVDERSGQP
ncbi:MAG: hypothetical protein ACREJC_00430 [Tepidisphaeraceae bacterium]